MLSTHVCRHSPFSGSNTDRLRPAKTPIRCGKVLLNHTLPEETLNPVRTSGPLIRLSASLFGWPTQIPLAQPETKLRHFTTITRSRRLGHGLGRPYRPGPSPTTPAAHKAGDFEGPLQHLG